MKNSYRFFNNVDCKYFPCHTTKKTDEFNCLFCYCPLYLVDDCGGGYKMRGHVKDCSQCRVPHQPNGYDQIMAKLEAMHRERKEKGR